LAVQVLSRSEPVSDLATRHGVNRKFIYQQANKARVALDNAFRSATPDEEGLRSRHEFVYICGNSSCLR